MLTLENDDDEELEKEYEAVEKFQDVSSLKDFVLDALSDIEPDLDVSGSQVIGLGHSSTDKSHPAKLTLPNKLDVPVLVKNSKHLQSTEKYKGIYIRPDQTEMRLTMMMMMTLTNLKIAFHKNF
ncbi:hypothetical protein JTB14_012882 [Gonioctena quinquepunctata]|nr:hypothetical protein JTB14_012882 [Gonioctena quinquepunctata]